MSPRGRRWRRIFVGMLLTVVAICVMAPLVLHLVIRRQLEAFVAKKFDAHLTVGSIEYVYPFGLVLTDAAITTQAPDGKSLQLITVPRLEVTLAHSPLSEGPLVVDTLEISDPQIHLVRNAAGMAGTSQAPLGSSIAPQPAAAPAKLSSLFQIRRLEMRGGQIVYDDPRVAGATPMVWNQLGINVSAAADSSSRYTYEIASDDEPRAYLRCTGSVDIDDLLVKVDTCALTLGMNLSTDDSPLPASVTALLRSWQARGSAQIELAGAVRLRDPGAGTYHASLQLRDVRARIPGMQLPLDSLALQLDCSDGTDSADPHPRLHLQSLEAGAGDARLSLADALVIADLTKMGWQLSVRKAHLDAGKSLAALPGAVRDSLERLRLTGAADFEIEASGPIRPHAIDECTGHLVMHPRNLTIQPPGFDRPIDGITDAAVTLANGDLRFETLRATYADNLLYVKSARVNAIELPGHLRAHEIAGCLTLGPSGVYPSQFVKYLRDTRPVGPFFFDGSFSVDSTGTRPSVDYSLKVHTTRGRLTLGTSRIALSGIDARMSLTPAGAMMSKFNSSMLDGSIAGTGEMHFTPGLPYAFRTECRDIELRRLGEALAKPGETPPRLSGRGILRSQFRGSFPADGSPSYRTLAGNGEFEIRRGDFWEVPIMKSIAGAFSKETLTFGAAAGQFRMGGEKLHFDRVVASSPLLGVEGSGDLTFAGAIDFKGLADPFGNWGDRIGDGGPLSEIAGAVQRTVNIATRQILYEIHVTGMTSRPVTTQILAPLVTNSVKGLLNLTRDQNHSGELLGELRKQGEAPASTNP